MLETKYRDYCDKITPSEALNEETVALMMEAQNHRAAPIPAPLRWRPAVVLPIAGTAVAAILALVLTGAWFLNRGGEHYEDAIAGNIDEIFQDHLSDKEDPVEKPDAAPEPSAPNDAEEQEPGEGESSNLDAAPDEQYGSSTPPSDAPEEDNKDQPSEDETEEPSIAVPSDPYGPEISEEKNVETYLSIRSFIDALTNKTAKGYGKNYYNARELLIVPKLLPDGARFRHLHLDTETGKYFYSYHFVADGKDYLIDIAVHAKTPKNLTELRLLKEHALTEEIYTGKKGDQLYYLFGEQDEVAVTLTEVKAMTLLTEEETAALLSQFELERCSMTNTIIEMKY